MELVINVNRIGNEKLIETLEKVLAVPQVTLVGGVKLPSNQYFKVTVQPEVGLTDAFGDELELADPIVKLIKTKQYIADEKALLVLAMQNGISAKAVKEKRVSIEAITRSEYSLEVNGYDMQDTKTRYILIDTRGLGSVLVSFESQGVLSNAQVLAKAIEKGIINDLQAESPLLEVRRVALDKDGKVVVADAAVEA